MLLLMAVTTANAQIQNPVHWAYGLKHLAGNEYEVHLLATIDDGWHIYAQKQSPDAIAIPTKVVISKMAGLVLIGKPIELGKKEKYEVKEAGITNMEYAGKVDFVQKVSIPPGLKEIKGTVTYQTCTHQQCLPAATINFSVPVP
jgi:DsbC/DsbD-like thiol-disulfide interchange protein